VTLTTPWGSDLDPDAVLQDYPRPQLVRDSYLNLNGYWQYAFTSVRRDAPPAAGDWDGQILVPFSPEAPLSGVNRQLQPQQFLWYRRTLRLPGGFAGERVLLHFGAVDQSCTVTVNGIEVGGHDGGYLPFALDVTEVPPIPQRPQPQLPPAPVTPAPMPQSPDLQPPKPSTRSSSGSATSATPATPAGESRRWTAEASGTRHSRAFGRRCGWKRFRGSAFRGWTWCRTSTPSP
jgi:hypothetical protein